MRWKPAAVVLVVVLLIVPAPALGVVRGSPELTVSAPENRFVAGENTQFEVTLTNEGDLDTGSARNPSLNSEVTNARALEATLQARNAPVDIRTDTRSVSRLPQGGAAPLPYSISVDEGAEPGTYQMELNVRYRYTSTIAEQTGARNQNTRNRSFDVTIRVDERAQFEVVDTESNLRVGSTGTVSVTMRNDGSETATDTTVALDSLNGDLTLGGAGTASRFVGNWEPGEQRTVDYEVVATESAEQQRYTFRATANFEDSDGITRQSEALPLGVMPSPETAFSLSNVDSNLRVGEERTLEGTITNDADNTVEDVVVQFTTENENISPAERDYSVGTLAPGESADFQYTVEVAESTDAGPRQFSFVAEYRDETGDTLTGDTLNLREFVRPETSTFDVNAVGSTVQNGGSTEMSVVVTNQGNETLTDISAKLFADSPISADDDEAYVSELEPGEAANLTFSVGASGALPKDYPVSIDFQYDDADGDTLISNTYRVPVTVTEPEGDGGGPPLVIIGGVSLVALVAIGGYLRFR